MSEIRILNAGITGMKADCIVNAANEQLLQGSGVCGVIFREAGEEELAKACFKIGCCRTGSACITPAFKLDAKYIIHAVGPVYQGGGKREEELLYGAYAKSLKLAQENGCKSIVFPLISAGIFGYPKEEAWKTAIRACRNCEDKDLVIYFAIPDSRILEMGKRILEEK